MIGRYVFASNSLIHLTSSRVIVQMIAVLALPPSADCRMRVSLLSRYGIWPLKDYFEHDSDSHPLQGERSKINYNVVGSDRL
jgi:hypothetical protein